MDALLALEPAVFVPQQPFLRPLRPETFRLLRPQLLHALLQAINAGLALGALARQRLALPFLPNLLSLLDALLALEPAVFSLQQPFLRPLRSATFRLLRLQLLYALLQAIDAVLALCALARQRLALPFLPNLLSLLDALLTLRRTRFGLFPPRRSLAHGGRSARARWCGDARLRASRHGWSLRRRGTTDLGAWPCNARCGRSRRCGDTRRRTRGHGWTLWPGSRAERRCGGSRHGRRSPRWAGHSRWWSCWSGCWRSPATWAPATWTPSRLGGRAGAHRDRGDTKKKRYNADAARKHDLNSLVLGRPEKHQRASAEIVRLGSMICIAILRCGTGANSSTALADLARHAQKSPEAHPAAAHRLAVE